MEPLTWVCPGYVTRVRPASRSLGLPYVCLFYHLIRNRLVPSIRALFHVFICALFCWRRRQKALFEEDGFLKTKGAANTEARFRTGILSGSDDDSRYGGDFDEKDYLDKVQESTFL